MSQTLEQRLIVPCVAHLYCITLGSFQQPLTQRCCEKRRTCLHCIIIIQL